MRPRAQVLFEHLSIIFDISLTEYFEISETSEQISEEDYHSATPP